MPILARSNVNVGHGHLPAAMEFADDVGFGHTHVFKEHFVKFRVSRNLYEAGAR